MSEQVADFWLGQLVGDKYRILKRLGEGGMGAVYEARHESIGRRFAVKFMRAELALNPSILARFEREAQAAGALENENIAAVTDFGRAPDGAPYIVMEFLQGEDLSRLLARTGPLPVPRAANLVIQACRGLEAAHAADIVHRDLKPENLFVVRRGDGTDLVKVLDFGIAKLRRANDSGAATRTGMALGTPYYMPPEQARGEKELDHRADVYALGVILYEILSGRKPHDGDGYNAILYKILTQPPARLETLRANLPPGLADLVHRAMASEPHARHQNVQELMAALAPFAGASTPVPVDTIEDASRAAASGFATVATPTEALARAGTPIGTSTAPATSLDRTGRTGTAAKRRPLWLGLLALPAAGAVWAAVAATGPSAETEPSTTPALGQPETNVSAKASTATAPTPPLPSLAPQSAAVPAPVPSGRPADTAASTTPPVGSPAPAKAANLNPRASTQKPATVTPKRDAAPLAPNSQRDIYAP